MVEGILGVAKECGAKRVEVGNVANLRIDMARLHTLYSPTDPRLDSLRFTNVTSLTLDGSDNINTTGTTCCNQIEFLNITKLTCDENRTEAGNNKNDWVTTNKQAVGKNAVWNKAVSLSVSYENQKTTYGCGRGAVRIEKSFDKTGFGKNVEEIQKYQEGVCPALGKAANGEQQQCNITCEEIVDKSDDSPYKLKTWSCFIDTVVSTSSAKNNQL